MCMFFFFNDTATTEIYTLSLHDALPISFVDLEPQKFTPAELAAFNEARRLTFGGGIRPIAFDTIDPRTERLSVMVLTTHGADVRVELRSAGALAGGGRYPGHPGRAREAQW